jgi:hypothetical protein
MKCAVNECRRSRLDKPLSPVETSAGFCANDVRAGIPADETVPITYGPTAVLSGTSSISLEKLYEIPPCKLLANRTARRDCNAW